MEPILSIELEGLTLFKRGKVRDVFELGEYLLIVSSDRISAFDVIMPNGIPGKGRVLTAMSEFWFRKTAGIIENHFITTDLREMAGITGRDIPGAEMLAGRSMLVKKSEPLPVECVVRGYLAGSGWQEYQRSGTLAGISLPEGMRESQRLPEPLFTLSTKEESGHDRNLTRREAADLLGEDIYALLSKTSLDLYGEAAGFARTRGIIIADTKFEFGICRDRTILIDEALTPDSSRFWPLEGYAPGGPQPSFDKQFVRDYLESIGWDKSPPSPQLPPGIVQKTADKYREAQKLMGVRS